ncbi:hypothetical protein A2U01_0058083 [Trifolium medium]|uniref:Uncharacterized protein n=1 Tax=Trifolium medium TaxID=97028 RepID=A0A392RKQ1_9FABA|nr:hypothetical protein [Trifolium medium]
MAAMEHAITDAINREELMNSDWKGFRGTIHLLSKGGTILKALRFGFRGLKESLERWRALMHRESHSGCICWRRRLSIGWWENNR